MKDDRAYLRHILECIEAIESYAVAGKDRFFQDRMIAKATLRELQELSESTQRLSVRCKEESQEIPWADIAGFRNVLVHDYLGVSLARVWEIVDRDLPVLKKTVQRMLG